MKKNKVIILHDTFLYKGGWERLILMMGKILGADIATGFFSKGSFDLRKEWFTWKMIEVSSEIFKKGFRHLKLKKDFMFGTKFLKEYNSVLFSWDSISAVRQIKNNKDIKKYYYCHTPPRYLYDLRPLYLQKVPFVIRPIFNILSFFFKKMYEYDISKIDIILTNSINTQKRIKNFLWLDSKVLYPPVNLKEFQYIAQEDYYLSFARLSDAKRVDNIVKAFKQLPDKKLLVIYGENDPAKEYIFTLARWYKNITFITLPWNIWFTDYVGKCIATIYIPVDEDFGMSPVESMAAGKPVLWVNEWGLKETIIDKKTGVLIPAWAEVSDIMDAVNYLTPKKCLDMKWECEKRAEDFSLDKFEKKLKDLVQ